MSKTILAIEDDSRFIRMIEQVLAQKGYKVLTADRGQETLRLLFDHWPDLVLLDVVMPTIDGLQTCDSIREIFNVPITILTDKRVNEEDIIKGLDHGAADYLSVDISKRRVLVNGKQIKLTPREFRLFTLLLENAGRTLIHKQLLKRGWGWKYSDDVDYVRIYIRTYAIR